MHEAEIEFKPVDFITVGTVGPRGNRVFHLQAAKGEQLLTLTLEKVQANALAEAIHELLDDLNERYPLPGGEPPFELRQWDLELREPIEPQFRVAQLGLGYDEASDMVVLVVQELLTEDEEETGLHEPRVARFWVPRPMMRALARYTERVVARGRPDPQHNGRILYYWT